jgi:hypothetical protein
VPDHDPRARGGGSARPTPPGTHPPARRRHPWEWGLADRTAAKITARAPDAARHGVGTLPGSLSQLIRWPRRRVSGRARLSGTPMRHLSPCLGPREVLLLPPLVVGPPGPAVLVLRARQLQPLAPGHQRAGRAVDVPSVAGAANAYCHPAPRAREDSRLGIRHRSGVPRALHLPRRARSCIRLSGRFIAPSRPVTRRSGMRARTSTLRTPALFATPARVEAIGSASPPVGATAGYPGGASNTARSGTS